MIKHLRRPLVLRHRQRHTIFLLKGFFDGFAAGPLRGGRDWTAPAGDHVLERHVPLSKPIFAIITLTPSPLRIPRFMWAF